MMFKCLKEGWKRFLCCRNNTCAPETVEILTASGMDVSITNNPDDNTVPVIEQQVKFVVSSGTSDQ